MAELSKKIQIGWQVFRRREATSEYITRYGACIDLICFDALCAKCGKPFMAKASKRNWRNKQLARRCEWHRQPGSRVRNDKPPIPVSDMPWWAKPARQARGSSTATSKAPKKRVAPRRPLRRPRLPAEPPRDPAHPSYLD
jgi:hypothetical protein